MSLKGSKKGQKRVTNAFSKSYGGPFGMPKQAILARCEPSVIRSGAWKIAKCPENGPFLDPRWVKNGAKDPFCKSVRTTFGMLEPLLLARFELLMAHYELGKIPNRIEKGPFCDQTWVKNGTTTRFSKTYDGPFGMLKQAFLARFEPVVTRFGPWKIPKCLENGQFWDPRWVKMGQKSSFAKVIYTIWEARTTLLSASSACADTLWSKENLKMP